MGEGFKRILARIDDAPTRQHCAMYAGTKANIYGIWTKAVGDELDVMRRELNQQVNQQVSGLGEKIMDMFVRAERAGAERAAANSASTPTTVAQAAPPIAADAPLASMTAAEERAVAQFIAKNFTSDVLGKKGLAHDVLVLLQNLIDRVGKLEAFARAARDRLQAGFAGTVEEARAVPVQTAVAGFAYFVEVTQQIVEASGRVMAAPTPAPEPPPVSPEPQGE